MIDIDFRIIVKIYDINKRMDFFFSPISFVCLFS